ncbi:hypothetical protein NEAUS03_0770 [Nematocida ausubeli]|nr:hypothetical protein NEAUS03_0770 [Nematocida ausubeli]
MSIVYVPALMKESQSIFEESIPSSLYARIPEADWTEIIQDLNMYMTKRQDRLIFRVFAPVVIGNILRTCIHLYVDIQVTKYLTKKNLILSHRGIYIHHPKERQYSGLDISME